MKKSCKRILSLFLAAVVFCTCFAALGITASAAGKITYSIDYENGIAYVTVQPADSADYLTYTTDGSVPTAKSKKFSTFKSVTAQTLFRVAEYTSEGKKVSGIKFTVTPKVSDVKITTTYETAVTKIELSCDTEGAAIYFTFDGTVPTENSILYTGAFNIAQKTKIKAAAFKKGLKRSAVLTKTVTIGEPKPVIEDKPADNGTASGNNTTDTKAEETKDPSEVVIEKDTSGVKEKVKYATSYYAESCYTKVVVSPKYSTDTIYYTLDGTVPSKTNGKKYNGKYIKITSPSVLRISEFNKKGEKIRVLTTDVTLKCAPVEYTCTDIYLGTKVIELSSKTKDAKIYYTLNGTKPSADNGILYTGPINVGESTTINAIAIKNSYKDSLVRTEKAERIPFTVVTYDENDPDVKELIEKINENRVANGLQKLAENKSLTYVANIRAKEISVLYSHTRPSGDSYVKVLSDFGITTKMCTEIILATKDNAGKIADKIIKSSDYKDYFIGSAYDFDMIGVGKYEYEGAYYWAIIIAKSP